MSSTGADGTGSLARRSWPSSADLSRPEGAAHVDGAKRRIPEGQAHDRNDNAAKAESSTLHISTSSGPLTYFTDEGRLASFL